MDAIINPVLLYVCLAVGAFGVALALPRRRVSPQIIGALIAAAAFGVVFLVLLLKADETGLVTNLYFYIFALLALGSGLRVISHQKPVYAALYFILTILSSSALYLLMGAEFMAFALIIIYAGAILITYLFVIMLATQAPTEEDLDALNDYDAFAREPAVAVGAGFLFLAVLTGVLAQGVVDLGPARGTGASYLAVEQLPLKVLRELDQRDVEAFAEIVPTEEAVAAGAAPPPDVARGMLPVRITDAAELRERLEAGDPRLAGLVPAALAAALLEDPAALAEGAIVDLDAAAVVETTNIELIGWDLIAGHPMALELAGVILLMAMLGAVVLARKQIELGEEEKAARVRTLGETTAGGGAR